MHFWDQKMKKSVEYFVIVTLILLQKITAVMISYSLCLLDMRHFVAIHAFTVFH